MTILCGVALRFLIAAGAIWNYIPIIHNYSLKGVSLDTLFTISEVLDVSVSKLFDKI